MSEASELWELCIAKLDEVIDELEKERKYLLKAHMSIEESKE